MDKRTPGIECQCCCTPIESDEKYCKACSHNFDLLHMHFESDDPDVFEAAHELRECPGNNCQNWPIRF